MKGLVGIQYMTKEDNKKGYTLPDALQIGQPRRVMGEQKLHNPEWLADLDKSQINRDFIDEVITQSLANLEVSISIVATRRWSAN